MKRKYQKRIIVQLDLKLNPKIGLNHHPTPLHSNPPHPTTNFSKASRHHRRLRFGM